VSRIHPTALVADGARIGDGATIGPYSSVGPRVTLGPDVVLRSHVVVEGATTIGEGTVVEPFAALGLEAQVARRRAENPRLEIGARCHIREHATVNTGFAAPEALTRIGDDCLLMIGSHVAHDCRVGNGVTLTNNAVLGGHVTLGDNVILGGGAAVHQFARVGEGAFIGGLSGIEFDVIPFGIAVGNRARLAGLNLVGLKRRGVPRASIHALRRAYRALFAEGATLAGNLEALAGEDDPFVKRLVAFVAEGGRRRLTTPRRRTGDAAIDEDVGP